MCEIFQWRLWKFVNWDLELRKCQKAKYENVFSFRFVVSIVFQWLGKIMYYLKAKFLSIPLFPCLRSNTSLQKYLQNTFWQTDRPAVGGHAISNIYVKYFCKDEWKNYQTLFLLYTITINQRSLTKPPGWKWLTLLTYLHQSYSYDFT